MDSEEILRTKTAFQKVIQQLEKTGELKVWEHRYPKDVGAVNYRPKNDRDRVYFRVNATGTLQSAAFFTL